MKVAIVFILICIVLVMVIFALAKKIKKQNEEKKILKTENENLRKENETIRLKNYEQAQLIEQIELEQKQVAVKKTKALSVKKGIEENNEKIKTSNTDRLNTAKRVLSKPNKSKN